ncbi:transposase [Micromonospora sp. NPDC047762]|uniref:transposase n=1 Tax=Micromonospora sp. NPDC047762 TaxID=3364255 RepID=UPI00371B47A0
MTGLLSQTERKTCWQLAEQAGYRQPAALQRLLRTAVWDAEQVVSDVQGLLVERLGDPQGVLIPDEARSVKKGTTSVGVQRQYTGTAGRIENSQVRATSQAAVHRRRNRTRSGVPSSCGAAGATIGHAVRELAVG